MNRLREAAGTHPNDKVRADLAEIQKRLDEDRARLDDIGRRIVDPQINEILRAGLAPADTILGAVNIAGGRGELRDFLAVADIIPAGRIAGSVGKVAAEVAESATRGIVQMGGAYGAVRKLRGYHAHHIPAKSVSPFSHRKGPSIAMLPEDHIKTLSYGRKPKSIAHRKAQADLIAKGGFRKAQQMDIDDIRQQFGDRYDAAIEQMLEYSRKVEIDAGL